ncbi:hypothetical protein Vi05172_g7669 [Venturia inaequalis]|nr:hypothetical protein Vi05172_g7669 [Venturia inaequalis]
MEDSVMSGMAVSPASKMPIELWDKVFKYLMPTDEELTPKPARIPDLDDELPFPRHKIQDALNLRMTCRDFSRNYMLCAALYRNITVHMTFGSVGKLASIADDPTLRRHVKRITFVHPHFSDACKEPTTYVTDLCLQLRSDATNSIEHGGDMEMLEQKQEEILASWKCPLDVEHLAAGITAYRQQRSYQETLFDDLYVPLLSHALENFPRVDSVRISGLTENLKSGEKTWLELNAPDVLIRESTIDEKDHNAGNEFVYKVFQALNGANVRPRNLSFINGHGIGPDFDWTKVNTDILSSIQSLDLSLRGAPLADKVAVDFDRLIGPIEKHATNLESLHFHFGHDLLPTDPPMNHGINDFLNFRFPKLRDFHLDQYELSGRIWATFIQAHPHLEQISHSTHTKLMDDAWHEYWTALHDAPKLKKFWLSFVPHFATISDEVFLITEDGDPSGMIATPEEVIVHRELYRYIHKQGAWTGNLRHLWTW